MGLLTPCHHTYSWSFWVTSTHTSVRIRPERHHVLSAATHIIPVPIITVNVWLICESCNIQSVLLKRPQPSGRQWTWEHAEGSKSQLDHIMLRGKWINSLQSCRAYSTVELDSDHRMLTARLKLSLRTTRKPGKRLQCSTSRSRYPL